MNKISRRTFVATSLAVPFSAILPGSAIAADMPMLEITDPTAVALGYIAQTENAEQNCANCQLYQGADGDESGGCAIFPGKAVGADAWCKSWVVKAG